ncbi:MAG: hypothetical protein WDL87_09310 [Candidatus Omnitrophota bacterium]|jgi:hypothetical protein
MKVPKWVRFIISGVIALFLYAVTFPSITGPGVPLRPATLIYIFCISVIPFLLVCIFAGRNKILEIVGWGVQFIVLSLLFMSVIPIGLLVLTLVMIFRRKNKKGKAHA